MSYLCVNSRWKRPPDLGRDRAARSSRLSITSSDCSPLTAVFDRAERIVAVGFQPDTSAYGRAMKSAGVIDELPQV